MDLSFLRGLFGSSARDAVPFATPVDEGALPVSLPAGLTAAPVAPATSVAAPAPAPSAVQPPPVAANPIHSYLGGLIKYQRPQGQTDADRMALIGATLKDVGGALRGGDTENVATALAQITAARSRAATQAALKAVADFSAGRPITPMAPDEGTGAVTGASLAVPGGAGAAPARARPTMADMMPLLLRAQAAGADIKPALALLQAANPQHKLVNVPGVGLVDYDPTADTSRTLVTAPDTPPKAPPGYRWASDGQTLELIPGYAEGQHALTDTRRAAIVAHPMPSHARAAGAASWLPPGAKIVHIPGGP